MPIRFPITDLLSENECYEYLLDALHPEGLHCPQGHALPTGQAPHDRGRAPLVKYRCHECGAVFNAFTNTVWSGTHYDCREVVLVLRGIAQGVSTQQLADELQLDYSTLLGRRHQIQEQALAGETVGLPDEVAEADEMYQNAGKKSERHPDPEDPPRCRANKRRGRGTRENDRPPTLGVVGRESGRIRLTVCIDTRQDTVAPKVEECTVAHVTLYTDEASAYAPVAEGEDNRRTRYAVCHSDGEWAADRDGDGIREVHCKRDAKASGQGFATSCARSEAYTRNIWRSTWRCSNWRTISSK
jgi:transposase-like protein